MSLPKIPEMPSIPCITPSAAISFILASIALEEIGLSHIINAEGEKIQAAIGSFECGKSDICDLLSIDKSVNTVLRTVLKKELLLDLKMVEALEALPLCSPTPPCLPNHPTPPCHPTPSYSSNY